MHLRFRILCCLLFLGAIGAGTAFGGKKPCTNDLAKEAEAATDNLKTWQSVYGFYKQYRRCDDGGVAEGVSDHVAKLFANHWESVPEYLNYADTDNGFEKFVMRHLDATIDFTHDAPKIRENAQQHCAPNLAQLCKDLLSRTNPPREMGPK